MTTVGDKGTDARSSAQERDARLFLEDLYGQKPDGLIAITIAPKWHAPHCVMTPADAVHYVVGKRDVYVRIGLVAHRPEKRGVEADTIAIPGLWVEIDVNGGPTSNGKRVKDGASTVEAAMEIAHSVAQPTVMVGSGYGLHAYHLFKQPWRLESDEDRAHAKRLVQGWQARIRREANERGVERLDSTHDLARVFRVPGSLNGKVDAPAPVRLLDDGGPRYTIEQLEAETIDTAEPTAAERDVPAGDVRAILDRHKDLANIAARKGTKPRGGTSSDWDFMLGCRAAEYGYDDDVLAALIRQARQLHGEDKGERDDYIERTVAAVRRRVGHVGAAAAQDAVLAELTKALRLGEVSRHVAATRVAGHGNTAAAWIVLDDGYSIEFGSFEHVAQPAKLADQLSTTVGIATEFSKLQARRVAALVRRASSRAEEMRDHELYIDGAVRFLQLAQTTEFDFADQADKWRVWTELDAANPEHASEGPAHETSAQRLNRESKSADTYARRVLIPVDRETGVRFVCAGWFQHFIRLQLGAGSTPHAARLAVLGNGWQIRGRDGRIKATEPGGSDLTLVFYLVPSGWLKRQGGSVQ